MIPTPTLSKDAAEAWRPALPGADDADILAWYHAVIPLLRPECKIVEIGNWCGRSLIFAAELLAAHGRRRSEVWGIDTYPLPDDPGGLGLHEGDYRAALGHIHAHALPGELDLVHLCRVDGLLARRLFHTDDLDMVMWDGPHDEGTTSRAIIAWESAIRPGGYLCGHDYSPSWPGVMRAVDSLCGPKISVFGTVWVCQIGH